MKHEAIRITVDSASVQVSQQISTKIKTAKSLCFLVSKSSPMPTVRLEIGDKEIISDNTDVALFKKTDSIGLSQARYHIDPIEHVNNQTARVTLKDGQFTDKYEVILYLFDE